MPALPTGTVTFLFTDIEGSTRLLQQLRDAYAEVLVESRRLVRMAVQAGGGQEVDTEGDAVFAAFPSAREALMAAVSAQHHILRHPWPDGAAVRVRMGLHTGEARIAEDGYVGVDVHRAARICAAAHSGQIVLSDTVSALVTKDLPDGVSLRDLGEHRLKDLAHPHRLFQVLAPDLSADFPPLRSLDAHAHNLPIQLTSFIGRAGEIAEVRRLLSTGRLVTLAGIGGSGKTRLATQIAAEVLEEYPDGVWLVEFAALSDSDLVPKAVASVLGVIDQSNRPMIATLTSVLRTKTVLLVLDNCEHVLAASADLAETLLRACPKLRVLATSREPLDLPGEAVRRVSSLSLPVPHSSVEELRHVEAVRLFVERAILTQSSFAVTDQNAAVIIQVVTRLDGIPLAIELAAARMRVLTVAQLAARLDDRFRLLTGGGRRTLPRHQTLRAIMDWSYDLLSDKERELLRRLSVFAGGWSLDAAEAVTPGGKVEQSDILDLLTQLVDKSLIVVETREGEARYRLLETVRQYALDRLLESDELAQVRNRHRDWYIALAERAYPEIHTEQQEFWLQMLEIEHDNFRAALGWCEGGQKGEEPGLRLTGALYYFWHIHGHWSEGRRWLERALANSAGAPMSALLRPLAGASLFASRQGDYEHSTELAERGLKICRDINDDSNVPELLFDRAAARLRLEDYVGAEQDLKEVLRLTGESNDVYLTSWALSQLAAVEDFGHGNVERAEALRIDALRLTRARGDKWAVAFMLYSLGSFLLRRGNLATAQQFYTESLRLSTVLGDKWVTNQCLDGLAGISHARQDYRCAARLLGGSEALRERLGITRPPSGRVRYEELFASSIGALGNDAFQAAWAEGRAMTLEQAIEYALKDAT